MPDFCLKIRMHLGPLSQHRVRPDRKSHDHWRPRALLFLL